jgi:hypothetical protein
MIASYGDHGLTAPTATAQDCGQRCPLAGLATPWWLTKLYRLAQSLPDARDVLDGLTKRNVQLTSSAA